MNNFLTIIYLLLFSNLLYPQSAYASDYTNSIGMKFKNIPAGSFYMGSCEQTEYQKFIGITPVCISGGPGDIAAAKNEFPQHQVHITKDFQMAVYEVTLGQFNQFIDEAGRDDLRDDTFKQNNMHGDSAAVNSVSWHDAQDFIRWLNKKEGGNHYRLPTEAEWEYAARAGTTTFYSWGNSESEAIHYAWYQKNAYDVGEQYPHPVGLKQPNPWGLYDMHGNVWEWVQDWFSENYYLNSPVHDPQGPSSGQVRGVRGGSWYYSVRSLRVALREFNPPSLRNYIIGFRLLRQP